jgi:hypothetical protein
MWNGLNWSIAGPRDKLLRTRDESLGSVKAGNFLIS